MVNELTGQKSELKVFLCEQPVGDNSVTETEIKYGSEVPEILERQEICVQIEIKHLALCLQLISFIVTSRLIITISQTEGFVRKAFHPEIPRQDLK